MENHSLEQPTGQRPGQPASGWARMVEFTGKGVDYFAILILNMLLKIITLGIYHFWAKVNQRKFIWEKTLLFGEPLAYTGTGKELFLGFLIVAPVLIIFMFLFQFLANMVPLSALLLLLIFLYLWQYASYRVLRYRLTRTRWRGIRGNMVGNASNYAWKGTLYLLLAYASIGILLPLSICRMISLKLNNVYFGNRRLQFTGTVSGIYRAILVPLVGAILSLVLMAVPFFQMINRLADPEIAGMVERGYAGPADVLGAYGLPFLFLGFIGLFIFSTLMQAALYRWLFRNLIFGEMRCRSTLKGSRLLFVHFTNSLILIVTFGIGYAWTMTRMFATCLNTIDYTGDPQIESLLQDTKNSPKFGEGLLEALDVDVAF